MEAVGLTKVFQRDRFTLLSCYLHFCNEEDALPKTHVNYDKLYKIRFLLQHLQQKFQVQHVPHQQVSVDECMVPFHIRLGFKQYCKDKPVMFGIKVFLLADATNGYNYNFNVYSGKDADSHFGLCSRVMIELAQPLFDKGYEIYTDRLYTSPLLAYYLSKVGLATCGTVIVTRNDLPQDLKRSKSEMKKGDCEWRVYANTGIVATVCLI